MSASFAEVDPELVGQVRRIGVEVAGEYAATVDRDARFPKETFAALEQARLLGALVPVADGGLGHSLVDAAATVRELARHCASSAMILAMHHIQVACLLRHGQTDRIRTFVRQVASEQLLLASSTTEIGIGGDTRRSSCHVAVEDGEYLLRKRSPVISYGEHADVVLVTARRDADAPPSDQVLVVCPRAGLTLDPVSGWDTLGFRGTCSLGFELTATGPVDLVCPTAFADISAQTMLPVAHLLWSSLWLGIAEEAYERARRFVVRSARPNPSNPPPSARRLAELAVVQQRFVHLVESVLAHYVAIMDDAAATSAIEFAAAINTLKVSASEAVVDVVNKAMLICGIAGYREDSEFSLGRLLRDAHGAAVMVNNDRILTNTSQLLLAVRR